MTKPLFDWEFCLAQLDTIYFQKDYEQVHFYKKNVFISLDGPSETGMLSQSYNWLEIGTFQPKFDKTFFFHQHSQPLYDFMQK